MDKTEAESIEKEIEKYTQVDTTTLSTKTLGDVLPIPPESSPLVAPTPSQQDHQELARSNVRNIIDKAKNTLDHMFRLSDQMENPRVYEALADMMRATAELNRDMVEIDQKIRENNAKPREGGGDVKTVNNNLFVTPTQLQDLILVKGQPLDPIEIPPEDED